MNVTKPTIIAQGRWFYIEEEGAKSIVFALGQYTHASDHDGQGGENVHMLVNHLGTDDLYSRYLEEDVQKVMAMNGNPAEWPLEDKSFLDLGGKAL